MRKFRIIILTTIFLCTIFGFLEYKGIIWHNSIFAKKYQVKGLDVSHYQGEINWSKVRKDNYHFVFIKATEGDDLIDNTFENNWREAKSRGIFTGAYHFFSMRSTGEEQAKNFMKIVPKEEDSLPPVIDIEIPLNHDSKKVKMELLTLATLLEEDYGKKPILYVTYDTYNKYIKNDYMEFDIWIRDILKYPSLGDRNWTFWQYNNRGRINGIDAYVDINVFNGNVQEFKKHFSISRGQ